MSLQEVSIPHKLQESDPFLFCMNDRRNRGHYHELSSVLEALSRCILLRCCRSCTYCHTFAEQVCVREYWLSSNQIFTFCALPPLLSSRTQILTSCAHLAFTPSILTESFCPLGWSSWGYHLRISLRGKAIVMLLSPFTHICAAEEICFKVGRRLWKRRNAGSSSSSPSSGPAREISDSQLDRSRRIFLPTVAALMASFTKADVFFLAKRIIFFIINYIIYNKLKLRVNKIIKFNLYKKE